MSLFEATPGRRLGVRLIIIVVGSILPLTIVAAITTFNISRAYNDAASARLLRLSKAVLSTVEGQVASIITAEEVLGVSSALQGNDLQQFTQNAQAFLQRFLPSANFVLSDLNDTQLVNTLAADPFSRRKNTSPAMLEAHRELIATGKPVVTQLVKGQVIGQFAIGVESPIFRGEQLIYILGMPITSKALSELLAQQGFDSQWTVAIWDRGGKVIARNLDWEQYVGRQAAPSIFAAIMAGPDQVITTTTFEGAEVLTAIAHSPLGITLALGVPRESITAPRRQALIALLSSTALCLFGSGFIAIRLARSLLASEHTRELLIQELNHRVGNILSTVQGIVRQSMRSPATKDEAALSLQDRIMALARVHRLLTNQDWKETAISKVIHAALEPYLQAGGHVEIIDKTASLVSPKVAQAVTLAMNELATNATKYGALSVLKGKVSIEVRQDRHHSTILWQEVDGPSVERPTRSGFGSLLLSNLSKEIAGDISVEYLPSGIICTLKIATETTET
jgi:two-component sensor histidine kinase